MYIITDLISAWDELSSLTYSSGEPKSEEGLACRAVCNESCQPEFRAWIPKEEPASESFPLISTGAQ